MNGGSGGRILWRAGADIEEGGLGYTMPTFALPSGDRQTSDRALRIGLIDGRP